jgi:hypothetical protein
LSRSAVEESSTFISNHASSVVQPEDPLLRSKRLEELAKVIGLTFGLTLFGVFFLPPFGPDKQKHSHRPRLDTSY